MESSHGMDYYHREEADVSLIGRVSEIKNRLKYLRKNNKDLKDEINKAYDCDEHLYAGANRFQENIANCRNSVVRLTENLRGNCHFKDTYLQRLDSNVFEVAYNNGVLGCLSDLRGKLSDRIVDNEDRIQRNSTAIQDLEDELRRLEAQEGKQDD